ncbi:MAG: hypothetical protein P1U89_27270 [Verrucomicrobiales bacterium]|nr:hypothetical protein [Verrucomicrobiales bacterium]
MINLKKIFWGAAISVLVIGTGSYAAGRLSNSEAVEMLTAMFPSTRFLCSSVITATSTILALILTLISFTARTEHNLDSRYYTHIKLIAKLACTAFIAAITLLLFINLPLEETSEKFLIWFRIIYYIILIYTSLLGGLLIAIMLMLYQTAASVILAFSPNGESEFIAEQKTDGA